MNQDQILVQTLHEIASVLTILPEVTVDSIDFSPAPMSMTLCINKLDSLAVVVYAADGANVPLHLWGQAPRRPIAARADGKYLRYRLQLPGRSINEANDSFMLFGCFLVWYLFSAGLLTEDSANALLEKWDGAGVASM